MTASVTDLTAAGQAKASRIPFYRVPRFTLSGLWLLVPAICEYQPANQEMDFEVTFKGW